MLHHSHFFSQLEMLMSINRLTGNEIPQEEALHQWFPINDPGPQQRNCKQTQAPWSWGLIHASCVLTWRRRRFESWPSLFFFKAINSSKMKHHVYDGSVIIRSRRWKRKRRIRRRGLAIERGKWTCRMNICREMERTLEPCHLPTYLEYPSLA